MVIMKWPSHWVSRTSGSSLWSLSGWQVRNLFTFQFLYLQIEAIRSGYSFLFSCMTFSEKAITLGRWTIWSKQGLIQCMYKEKDDFMSIEVLLSKMPKNQEKKKKTSWLSKSKVMFNVQVLLGVLWYFHFLRVQQPLLGISKIIFSCFCFILFFSHLELSATQNDM